jgi:hypothetical protein
VAQFDPNKPYEAAQQDSAVVHASGFDPNKPYDAAGSPSDPPKEEGVLSRTWNKTKKAVGDADEAVTNTLAPNPQNYESLGKTNAIEVPKTLGREVYEGGKSILGMIPGAYHTVADAPTDNETAAFGNDHVKRIASRALGLTPIVEAGITYADPNTRPSVDQALSVLPEAIGQGAGAVVGGKIAEVAAPRVVAGAKKLAPVLTGDESFVGRQNYRGVTRGVVGNDYIPKPKGAVAEAKPGLSRVPYPDAESVVSPKETPELVGNDYTEGTPQELGKGKPSSATQRVGYAEPTEFSKQEAGLRGSNYVEGSRGALKEGKPSRATERTMYAEPTEFSPKEESLVGNEHTEPATHVQGTLPLRTGLERVPYAEATSSTPVATEEGLVGNEYSEGSKPSNRGTAQQRHAARAVRRAYGLRKGHNKRRCEVQSGYVNE